jgi:hypothetical protein
MEYTKPDELARVRAIADALGCITEEDFQMLAKITASTEEAWRKRGLAPEYIRLGNRVLYTHAAVGKRLESLKRAPPSMAKGLL